MKHFVPSTENVDDDDGRDVNTPDQASARASGKAAVRGGKVSKGEKSVESLLMKWRGLLR